MAPLFLESRRDGRGLAFQQCLDEPNCGGRFGGEHRGPLSCRGCQLGGWMNGVDNSKFMRSAGIELVAEQQQLSSTLMAHQARQQQNGRSLRDEPEGDEWELKGS